MDRDDQPVGPGADEGIARAIALVRRIAAREPWQDHFGKPWEDEAAEIVAAIDREPNQTA